MILLLLAWGEGATWGARSIILNFFSLCLFVFIIMFIVKFATVYIALFIIMFIANLGNGK